LIQASGLLEGALDVVLEVMTTKDFYIEVARQRNVETAEITRTDLGDGSFQMEIIRTVTPGHLPAIARHLISGPVRVTQLERWTKAADGRGWIGRTQVSVPRLPIKLRGIQELRQTPDGLLYSVTGEIGAAIPILSQRLAKAGKPILERMVARQCQHVRACIKTS
jgi:hypothetical protein